MDRRRPRDGWIWHVSPRFRNGALCLALVATLAASAEGRAESGSPVSVPAAERQIFRGRGVYYFDGPIRSPVGDIGSRSPFATNRLALDDEFSEVHVDPASRRILFRNEHRYGLNKLVGCLLLLGRGTTASGREVPVAAHLKIHKTGNHFRPALHPHPTVREKVVAAVFAPFDVVLSNGESEKSVLTPVRAIEAVREPEISARLAKIFVQVTDHLEGVALAPEKPGSALVDLSIGFGGEKINMKMARVRLISRSAENGELVRRGSVGAMLEKGDWEFRVDSLSPYVPKWEFGRNFFLFGIERVPALEKIARRGLLRGEALVVGFRDGEGYIGVNEALSEIPNPADVARAYLEFHFVGGMVSQQVADLPHRLQ
jgi:hypothetical protein